MRSCQESGCGKFLAGNKWINGRQCMGITSVNYTCMYGIYVWYSKDTRENSDGILYTKRV